MNYDEAINFWNSRINYEVRSATPKDLKLERMRELLHRLGDPQKNIPTIHITGTKGKGSTAAMTASIARAAGLTTGLFTSPHLVKVEERIQVNGEPIPGADLASLMNRVRPVVEMMDLGPFEPITFFEIVTALGWLHFLSRKVDLAVVEVGLGGRFDSTNVCSPRVSAITSIGYDHMAQLGRTLDEIAYQKAGILKSGVPCVSGVTQPSACEVIRRIASETGSPLHEIAESFELSHRVGLLGEHQRRNAAVAIAAIGLSGMHIPPAAIALGLEHVVWPARIEVVRHDPVVVLDCAHNVPSVEALVRTLRCIFPAAKRKTCVFAVSGDKQYDAMLPVLADYFDEFVLTRYGNNPRCVPPESLADLLPGSVRRMIRTPAIDAWDFAKSSSSDLIAITGSVFLAGELQSFFRDTIA